MSVELELRAELDALRRRLEEAEQTLDAIRSGEVDALVVGSDVYTLDSANAASNRLRSDVLAQMHDAVVAVDGESHVIFLNAAAERQYGRTASDALGYPVTHLHAIRWYHDSDPDTVERALGDQGAWRGENVHVRRDGTEFHVESTITILRDAEGAPRGRLIVSRDVTERYRAEAALQHAMRELERSQRQFSTLVENSPFVFARFDRRMRHAYVSPAIEAVTGLPPAAFIGRTHREAGMPAELAAEWEGLLREVLASGKVATTRFSFSVPTGDVRHFEGRLIPEAALDGRVESVLSIAIDVTERELADRERKAADASLRESDRRKDVFLATLAHELRNPLAPIGNALQIMRMSAAVEAHQEGRNMIERQLRQLVHLVDDLLDVSRISQNKIELRRKPLELSAVIRNAIETSRPLIDAGRHELVVALAAAPEIDILGDMTRLTQVVSNLLNNAAKYTPAGGRITVTTLRDGPQAVIQVLDTGIGIPADRLPEVFELFAQVDRSSTLSQGGLGIGLALVKRLVEMHGGTVSAKSDGEGAGSQFEVRLPIVARPPTQRAPEFVPVAPDGRGIRILVADDNRDNANSVAAVLRLMGFAPSVAYDGDEALQLAAEMQPRVAILDLGMPRLGGEAVARRLRAEYGPAGILLIALSGWGRDDDRRRSREAGFDHHLVKPLDFDILGKLLQALD